MSDSPDIAQLGLLPDRVDEKSAIVEEAVRSRPELRDDVTLLLRSATAAAVEAAVEEYLRDPDGPGTSALAYEAALYHPQHVRKHRARIDDESVGQALLAGAPDTIVDELVAAYRDDPDPATLRALAAVRTDDSLSALIDLRPHVAEHEHEKLDLYIETSGAFPDTRTASVYFDAYRGFVVPRDESPHHMGAGFGGSVPECPLCETPATRVLSLDAAATGLDLRLDPSFFWFSCDCQALDYVYVEFKEGGGIAGLMVPMTDGAPPEPIVPAGSMLLERHPNQHGFGIEIVSGFAMHQVGGYPPWIALARHPFCPRCSLPMRFLAAVDSGATVLGPMGFDGILYGFWCDDDAVSCTTRQGDELF